MLFVFWEKCPSNIRYRKASLTWTGLAIKLNGIVSHRPFQTIRFPDNDTQRRPLFTFWNKKRRGNKNATTSDAKNLAVPPLFPRFR